MGKTLLLPAILAACLALSFTGSATAQPVADEPWLDAPSFGVPAAELLEKAGAIPRPAGAGAEFLLMETRVALDARGRTATTIHHVYRILDPSGVEPWANLRVAWSPWYQERPVVRARVIMRDGTTRELDDGMLADSPAGSDDDRIFTDRRLVEGPLPGVAAGSIIEIEIVVRDSTPFFEAGITDAVPFARPVPVRRARLLIDAPAALPLRTAAYSVPGFDPQRSTEGGRVRLRYERGPIAAIDAPEPFAPPDVRQVPVVAFATGRSWNEVAAAYGTIVDSRIAGSDVEAHVREIVKDATTRDAKISAIVRALHRDVRYTGVEFGEASIVPATPAETLRRRYGDCKDKAVLLVAMLRAAGLPSDVALVKGGDGPDLDANLPGLGDFNHAIVRVAGEPATWIDATAAHSRPGDLPANLDGRLALVAARGTQGLVAVPETSADANRAEETREIFLQESGPSRVVETTRCWGYQERDYRLKYADADEKDLRRQLETYARDAYTAKSLDRCDWTRPGDFGAPFEIRLEISGAEAGTTTLESAYVVVPYAAIAAGLASEIPNRAPEHASGGAAGGDAPRQRRHDFRLPVPLVSQWTYRIHPPPGFSLQAQPGNGEEQAGPVTFTTTFATEDDGTATLTLRLRTGRRLWSPADLEKVQDWLVGLKDREPLVVAYDLVGYRHQQEGRIREALQEFRRLAALHPAEALHQAQIASALLAGGMGEPARRQARRATEMDPTSVRAWNTLGWTLIHDLVGRQFRKGCDLAEAERCYRKARALDPGDVSARAHLAQVLQYDSGLRQWEDAARLDAAIAELRSIRDDLGSRDFDDALMEALAHAGRFSELREFAGGAEAAPFRNIMLLAAIAATSGAEAALKESANLASSREARQEILGEAAFTLIANRLYPEAGALMEASTKGSPKAASAGAAAEAMARCRRLDEASLAGNDPVPAVSRMLFRLYRGVDDAIFTDSSSFWRGRAIGTGAAVEPGRFVEFMRAAVASTGLSPAVLADITLSATEWKTESDGDAGTRVTANMAAPGNAMTIRYYLVKEGGEWRLFATSENPGRLGVRALQLTDDGKVEAAGIWLAWARQEFSAWEADILARPPFLAFWSGTGEASGDQVREAAAALAATSDAAEVSIPVLLAGAGDAAGSDDRLRFDHALATALLSSNRHAEAVPVLERIRAARPDSQAAFAAFTMALHRAGRFDEVRKAASERLLKMPGDRLALRGIASAAGAQNRWDEARKAYQEIVEAGSADAMDYNNLAWNALVRGAVDNAAIEMARKAALFNRTPSVEGLHTLAALYAETGRNSEAMEILLRQMDMKGGAEPDSDDWLVFGRIAENHGEIDAAAAAYRRVTPPDDGDLEAGSSYSLAQRRLSVLPATERAPNGGPKNPGR